MSIMYTAARQPEAGAAAAAAEEGTMPRREDPPLPAILIADALVLAAGGFAANKDMLQVNPRGHIYHVLSGESPLLFSPLRSRGQGAAWGRGRG